MDLILTHEQADFDALAAMLGAYLFDGHALPVLPRRINRNGRDFVHLYRNDLPFVEPRSLPGGRIHHVLLVDTQSFASIKGMGEHTTVSVLDHHPLRGDLPATWQVTLDTTGACTTMLVERLQEAKRSLSMIEATLLLLGIYEDTGSLTYASTTPRDIRAAAYLLEMGAKLQIMSEYLNPPLSSDQLLLYDRLLTNAESYQIHGQNVIITSADAGEMNEEIASVAHKLRDLLEPDALFLLARSNEGVRMVARSTTDRIDVGDIAASFGGGGHSRAASALIQENPPAVTLDTLHQELLRLLPMRVRPSITVGQIMSRRPRLLSSQTSAQEAALMMRRYGYEGFPVVQDGKVVGLLTRRAVDRALAHELNLPAASLMDAGEITVQSNHSIDYLQRMMNTSGWGQLPVVDAESGEIIGIVTRTDLLKTLAAKTRPVVHPNLSAKLEAALPPARLAFLKAIADQAFETRTAVYIVGGFVRDLLLDRPSQDFDVVVEGDAIALGKSLVARYGGRVVIHSRFGTAKWDTSGVRQALANALLPGSPASSCEQIPESLDLISARTEFYDYPSALPTVERSSIKLDLHRRDFTINTLALRLDGRHYGELHDYWGGYEDIRHGWVRVLHSLSFIDDPTRLLRAVRFEQRFGFHIEKRTLELMNEARPLLKQVSGDRLRHELDQMIAEEGVVDMFTRLNELGLQTALHPDLPWSRELSTDVLQILHSDPEPEWKLPEAINSIPLRRMLVYIVWLCRLPKERILPIGDRLRLPGTLLDLILGASGIWHELPDLRDARASELTARLDSVPMPGLYGIYRIAPEDGLRHIIRQYVTHWQYIHPTVNGHDLERRGITPGPIYREILSTLRNAWLDGEIHSPEEEEALLAKVLRESQ